MMESALVDISHMFQEEEHEAIGVVAGDFSMSDTENSEAHGTGILTPSEDITNLGNGTDASSNDGILTPPEDQSSQDVESQTDDSPSAVTPESSSDHSISIAYPSGYPDYLRNLPQTLGMDHTIGNGLAAQERRGSRADTEGSQDRDAEEEDIGIDEDYDDPEGDSTTQDSDVGLAHTLPLVDMIAYFRSSVGRTWEEVYTDESSSNPYDHADDWDDPEALQNYQNVPRYRY